jgi:Holliday junction resolvase-like predicted endonuclease
LPWLTATACDSCLPFATLETPARRLGVASPDGQRPGEARRASRGLVVPTPRLPGHELDVVVRRGRRLVFCEVKEKRGERFGDPLEMVDAEKRRRLRRAAEAWLARHPELEGLSVSYDVIAVRDGRLQRIGEAF